jgi:hypothetical protein
VASGCKINSKKSGKAKKAGKSIKAKELKVLKNR